MRYGTTNSDHKAYAKSIGHQIVTFYSEKQTAELVPLLTLDQVVNTLNIKVGFKIDVQGAEEVPRRFADKDRMYFTKTHSHVPVKISSDVL